MNPSTAIVGDEDKSEWYIQYTYMGASNVRKRVCDGEYRNGRGQHCWIYCSLEYLMYKLIYPLCRFKIESDMHTPEKGLICCQLKFLLKLTDRGFFLFFFYHKELSTWMYLKTLVPFKTALEKIQLFNYLESGSENWIAWMLGCIDQKIIKLNRNVTRTISLEKCKLVQK